MEEYTRKVLDVILNIPKGRVLTYGGAAALAGNPKGARQVSRILHSMSRNYNLPWHRVINSRGRISLPRKEEQDLQRDLLESEGVIFDEKGSVDLNIFLYQPGHSRKSFGPL